MVRLEPVFAFGNLFQAGWCGYACSVKLDCTHESQRIVDTWPRTAGTDHTVTDASTMQLELGATGGPTPNGTMRFVVSKTHSDVHIVKAVDFSNHEESSRAHFVWDLVPVRRNHTESNVQNSSFKPSAVCLVRGTGAYRVTVSFAIINRKKLKSRAPKPIPATFSGTLTVQNASGQIELVAHQAYGNEASIDGEEGHGIISEHHTAMVAEYMSCYNELADRWSACIGDSEGNNGSHEGSQSQSSDGEME